MAVVRKLVVTKNDDGWFWNYGGALWQFRLLPLNRRGLWRNGYTLSSAVHSVPLLCVDDAVIYSKGYEKGSNFPPPAEDVAA